MDYPNDPPIVVEQRCIHRRPVPHVEPALGALHRVLLQRHRIPPTRRDDALERCTQVRYARRGFIVGIIGEHVEDRMAEDVGAPRQCGFTVVVGGGDDRKPRWIGPRHEEWRRNGLEQRLKVRRLCRFLDTGRVSMAGRDSTVLGSSVVELGHAPLAHKLACRVGAVHGRLYRRSRHRRRVTTWLSQRGPRIGSGRIGPIQ